MKEYYKEKGMALAQWQEEARYTYADYFAWEDDGVRRELIDGQVYEMAEPATIHQDVLGGMYLQLGNCLKDKPCKLYPVPFAVRLFPPSGRK
jgi:hypothetical protein